MTSRTLTCSSDACTVGTPGTGMTGTRLIRPAPPSSRQPPALNRRLAAAPSPAPNTKVAPVRHMLPGQLLVTRCDDVTGMYLISNNCGQCGVTRRTRVYLSACVQQHFVSTYFTYSDFFLNVINYVIVCHSLNINQMHFKYYLLHTFLLTHPQFQFHCVPQPVLESNRVHEPPLPI